MKSRFSRGLFCTSIARQLVCWLGAGLLALLLSSCSKDPKAAPDQSPSRQVPKPPQFRPLPDVELMAKQFELPVQAVRSAYEVARRTFPLPDTIERYKDDTPAEVVSLGHQLFFDPRLSKSGKISCQSCHVLRDYGVDGLPKAVGHEGAVGRRNTPSVFNLGAVSLFFWDGRANTLEQQAAGPLLNPKEMALENEAEVVRIVQSIPGYVQAFERAFPKQDKPVTFGNIVAAIAAYERRLVTPAPWDKYLAGDDAAVSDEAKRGLALLYHLGCGACHSGATFGGSNLERLGVKEPWPNQEDLGVFEVHGRPMDRMLFKAPSLRNVEKTAPYFHDASANTLEEAVRKMAKHQLGKELEERDVASLVAFLKSLTGELPTELIAAPELPR